MAEDCNQCSEPGIRCQRLFSLMQARYEYAGDQDVENGEQDRQGGTANTK